MRDLGQKNLAMMPVVTTDLLGQHAALNDRWAILSFNLLAQHRIRATTQDSRRWHV